LYLLELLHQRRLAGARRPWLKVADIPSDAEIPPDVAKSVVEVLTQTKFGHPDRYQDRVSKQLLSAMRRADTVERAVSISVSLRFKSSPGGLSSRLAPASPMEFRRLVATAKNGTAYEQTGLSKEEVSNAIKLSCATTKGPTDWCTEDNGDRAEDDDGGGGRADRGGRRRRDGHAESQLY
jgi:hypothetical protein